MRNRWSFAVLALLLVVPLVAGAAEDEFLVDGGGWGHGVGMSQYGAYGMALDGSNVAEIISHFYSGAQLKSAQSLGTVPGWIFDDEALAVNVASRRTSLDFRVMSGEVDVCHRGDGSNSCGTPDVTVEAGQILRVAATSTYGRCTRAVVVSGSVVGGTQVEGNCDLDITWDDDFGNSDPSTIVRVLDPSEDPDLEYARGPFEIRTSQIATAFDVTVRLGLEEYLYGIGEVPLSWPDETLKAQAVTARSFAVNTVATWGGADGSGRRPDCGCHIRRTTADQNYDAWNVEGSSNGPRWKSVGVDGTAGLVVTHSQVNSGNSVVTTYYSSSTGGVTENVETVFGGSPQPHLKSVADPGGGNPNINPLARWQRSLPESVLRTELCDEGHCWNKVTGAQMVSGPPGANIRFLGLVNGELRSAEVSAVWLYRILNARGERVSPYVSGVLAPSPFVDIGTSIHFDNILFIAELGITRGCNPPANDRFCPRDSVTRQQMASFLVRALELPRSEEDHFVDDTGSVHEDNINALAAAGITRGCNPPANDRFCPDRAVTRGEMAAFLVRAYVYTDPGEGDLFIDDDDSIFAGDIDRLAVAGVTRGCNPPANDRFCPNDPVTRDQMASFLARAIRG